MKITGLFLSLLLVLSSCGGTSLTEISRNDSKTIAKINDLVDDDLTTITYQDDHGAIFDVEAYQLYIGQDSTIWSDLITERRSAILSKQLINVQVVSDEGATLRGGLIGAMIGVVGTLGIALAIDHPIDGSIARPLLIVPFLTALPGFVIGMLQTTTTVYYFMD
jgi:hypothetical protein